MTNNLAKALQYVDLLTDRAWREQAKNLLRQMHRSGMVIDPYFDETRDVHIIHIWVFPEATDPKLWEDVVYAFKLDVEQIAPPAIVKMQLELRCRQTAQAYHIYERERENKEDRAAVESAALDHMTEPQLNQPGVLQAAADEITKLIAEREDDDQDGSSQRA